MRSKDKLNDLLWEVVWPRFLARGALRAVKRHLHNQELPCISSAYYKKDLKKESH